MIIGAHSGIIINIALTFTEGIRVASLARLIANTNENEIVQSRT